MNRSDVTSYRVFVSLPLLIGGLAVLLGGMLTVMWFFFMPIHESMFLDDAGIRVASVAKMHERQTGLLVGIAIAGAGLVLTVMGGRTRKG